MEMPFCSMCERSRTLWVNTGTHSSVVFFFLVVKCFFVFKLTYWILWTFDESQGCLFSNGRTYAERILRCQLTDRINVEIHFWNVNFYGYIYGRQWNNHIIHFLKSPCLNHSFLKRDAKCKLTTTMNTEAQYNLVGISKGRLKTHVHCEQNYCPCKLQVVLHFYAQDCVSCGTEGKQSTGNNTCSSVDYSASMKIINCSLRV